MKTADVPTPLPARSQALSPAVRRTLFFLSLASAVPVVGALEVLNGALQNPVAPHGVMSFELARTLARQNQVLDSWDQAARLRLSFCIGLDFFCVIAFLGVLTFGCVWLAEALRRRGAFGSTLGMTVAWALGTMGALWMLQNALLTSALFGHSSEVIAEITYGCALVKFTVLAAGFAYLLFAGLALVIQGRFRAPSVAGK